MAEMTLYRELAQLMGAGESKFVPLIFEELVDDDEARLLLAASPPATVEELAEKTGMGEEKIKGMIDPLFKKGLLFKSKKETGTRYYCVRNVLQMHDATAVAPDASKRMLDLWKEFTSEEFDGFMRKVEEVLPSPAIRVIPINVTIEARSKILAFIKNHRL